MSGSLVIPSLGWPRTGDRLIRYNPSPLPWSHSCSYCWFTAFSLYRLVLGLGRAHCLKGACGCCAILVLGGAYAGLLFLVLGLFDLASSRDYQNGRAGQAIAIGYEYPRDNGAILFPTNHSPQIPSLVSVALVS